MQMGRLFEIVYLLLERKTVTAGELAERFEVSVRTIYRDVEQLSAAGIPIYANKGRGGGIRLLEDYVLNKSVLTETERSEILWALQGISAVKGSDGTEVLKKLSSIFGTGDMSWIEVDFSGWGADNSHVFGMIKTAVTRKQVLELDYYNSAGGLMRRQIEPLQLYFKDKSWYARAFCRKSGDFRMFRITRMRKVCLLEEHFEREFREEDWNQNGRAGGVYEAMVTVKIKIDRSQAYRVYDDFGEDALEVMKDGSFLATLTCPENEWVYGYLLSYGAWAKVVSPDNVKKYMTEKVEKLAELYL